MNRTPSDYPNEFIENIPEEVFNCNCHQEVEQSAIYSDIKFHCYENPENGHGIILTSQCDIERFTSEDYILVARLAPVAEVFSYWLQVKNNFTEEEISGEVPIPEQKTKRKGILKNFKNKYMQNQTFAYYYLPCFEENFPHSFVCFEITECLPVRKLKPENKICVLRSPFREAVPTHYASYIGRIGVPPYREEFLSELLNGICKLRDN